MYDEEFLKVPEKFRVRALARAVLAKGMTGYG
jgi:hypothetical protein